MSIVLYKTPTRPWGMPNLSPFSVKLETYLKLKGLPYTAAVLDLRKAPKGKMPYVRIDDGEPMGDSQLVMERLEREHGPSLDAHLTAEQKAVGHMLRRALDEAHYFIVMYLRWRRDEAWPAQREEFAKVLPAPLKLIVPLIRRSIAKNLHAQGTGRHSLEEVMSMGIADWDAASVILGDTPFLFGGQPTTYDPSLFAFLDSTLAYPVPSKVSEHLNTKKNLVAYRERIRAKYFADSV